MRDTATFECGCKVVGMKTAPFNFGLVYCRLHGHAAELREALEALLATTERHCQQGGKKWAALNSADAVLKATRPRKKKTEAADAKAEGGE